MRVYACVCVCGYVRVWVCACWSGVRKSLPVEFQVQFRCHLKPHFAETQEQPPEILSWVSDSLPQQQVGFVLLCVSYLLDAFV